MRQPQSQEFVLAVACALSFLLNGAAPSLAAETPGQYSAEIQFDINKVPFSRFGSYMAYSHLGISRAPQEGLYLRTVHGNVTHREVFRVEVLRDGKPVVFREIATPTLLRLEAPQGSAEICFSEPEVISLRGRGVGLRLAKPTGTYGNAFEVEKNRWEVNSAEQDVKFMLTALAGKLSVDAPWDGLKSERIIADFLPDTSTHQFEATVEEFEGSWHARKYGWSFEESLTALNREYAQWLAKMPKVPEEFQKAADLAAYVNWESVVAPEGHFERPAMLMSKNWMTNVWSWDNCFNAMALILGNPDLAWDQYFLLFDSQNADGAFPDSTNDRTYIWSFSKPPIHGWVLSWMLMRSANVSQPLLAKVYEPLARWTKWYFKFRDYDHDGLPQYNHGNDSGWDNATVFLTGPPVETPDLAAYLVLQVDVLSQLAEHLDKPRESREWKRRADELLNKMLAEMWKGDHFVALHSGDHRVQESESLMLFLPLILGNRLPEDVRSKLVAGLTEKGRFLTPYGLATESLRSPHYQADGYWLGPVWAPSTLIITEGLEAAGQKALARDIRRKFCEMVAKSGNAENFNALTGEGLRDPAYTWTSSVFLIFAHEMLTP